MKIKYTQRIQKEFSHPLLDGCEKYIMEDFELDDAFARRADKKIMDRMVMAHLYVVRDVVGRYLYYFPKTHLHLDDMCSVGFSVISRIVPRAKSDDLFNLSWHVTDRLEQQIGYYLDKQFDNRVNCDPEFITDNTPVEDMNFAIVDLIDEGQLDSVMVDLANSIRTEGL